MTYEEYKFKIQGASVAVLGLGISNIALISFLNGCGVYDITVFDKNDEGPVHDRKEKLLFSGAIKNFVSGEGYLSELEKGNFNFIFKSPVIRHDIPEIAAAVEKGAVLTSEMQLFMELCPCKMIAITGSDGKTTTTTLTAKLLEEHFKGTSVKVWLGGNIGTPLISAVPEISPDDRVVLELSSFQLMTLTVSPHVAVITNITPNHLDVHKSYAEYIEAKCRVFAFRDDCRVILNSGNDETAKIGEKLLNSGRKVSFFSKNPECIPENCRASATLSDGNIVIEAENKKISAERSSMLLPGDHNCENLMAAVLAASDDISEDDVHAVAYSFPGVEHRLEFVRKLDGVSYYNSSIDSSPNRTLNALSVFAGNVVLIAGGKDKNIPYGILGPALAEKVKCLILIGPTAPKIEAAMRQTGKIIPVFYPDSYQSAVSLARSVALPGDTVLLSPASTSFDLFRNFEERGNLFRKLVNDLD